MINRTACLIIYFLICLLTFLEEKSSFWGEGFEAMLTSVMLASDVRVCVHTDGLTLSESDTSWRWYGQQVTSLSIII